MGNALGPPKRRRDDEDEKPPLSTRSPSIHRTNSSPLPDLHRSITLRERRGTDPYEHYEALEMIGFGSMGSITRVRKRREKEGGSARNHNLDPCADCLNHPWWGGVARSLIRAKGDVCEAVEPLEACCDGGVLGKGRLASGGLASSSLTPTAPVSTPKSNNSSGRAGKKKAKRVLFESLSSITSYSDSHNPRKRAGRRDSGGHYEASHYALKSIHLSRVRNQAEEFLNELRNEVVILRSLDHPFVVRAIETFEHRRQLYVVMELCTGGDLYTRDPYTEEEAARITRMVLSAVSYMHERNVVHRDLKYENIMFANHHPQSEVKIIDFGLSKKFGPDERYLREGVGTIYTMAPQVLEGKYTSACDLWSIGVITYALLSSQVPFYSSKRRKLVEKIKKGNYDFKGRRWSVISEQAKEFVSDLLRVDPDVRPTAEEARKSLWLNRSFAGTVRLSDDMNEDVHSSIFNFSKYNQLQKLALMVVAHKSSSEEIGFLRKAFQKYDKGAGVISRSEFRSCLASYGYSKKELDHMFEAVDIDSTGYIRYTEFLAATIEVHGAINEERLAEAFDRLDSDDSGYISADNLRSILGKEIPQDHIDKILQEAAIEDDKKISYDEFLSLWDVDQERQRAEALQSVMVRQQTKGSDTSLSSFATSPSETTNPSNGSGGDSSSPSQVGLSISGSGLSGSSRARLPPSVGTRPNLPTILSPSVQPTEAPVEPDNLPI